MLSWALKNNQSYKQRQQSCVPIMFLSLQKFALHFLFNNLCVCLKVGEGGGERKFTQLSLFKEFLVSFSSSTSFVKFMVLAGNVYQFAFHAGYKTFSCRFLEHLILPLF